jgi:ATP-dependent RNA helicase DeaD
MLGGKPAAADAADAAAPAQERVPGQRTPRELRTKASRGAAAPDTPRHTGKGGRFGPQATYRLAVGRIHGAQPGNIVGAIANEADLDGSQINGVEICEDHAFVRLPADVPQEALDRLARVRVRGRELALTRAERRPRRGKPHRGRDFK